MARLQRGGVEGDFVVGRTLQHLTNMRAGRFWTDAGSDITLIDPEV
jgi:hypothetical protein